VELAHDCVKMAVIELAVLKFRVLLPESWLIGWLLTWLARLSIDILKSFFLSLVSSTWPLRQV
jgi:hypothetical protein